VIYSARTSFKYGSDFLRGISWPFPVQIAAALASRTESADLIRGPHSRRRSRNHKFCKPMSFSGDVIWWTLQDDVLVTGCEEGLLQAWDLSCGKSILHVPNAHSRRWAAPFRRPTLSDSVRHPTPYLHTSVVNFCPFLFYLAEFLNL
jgi:hypothetical protein